MSPGKIARILTGSSHGTRPRTKYEFITRKSTEPTQPEGIRHVLDPHPALADHHTQDVESVLVLRTPVRSDPRARRPDQLLLFGPADGLRRCAEVGRQPGSYLHKGNQPTRRPIARLARDQVEIAVAVPEAAIQNGPTARLEPASGDRFATYSQQLPPSQHTTSVRTVRGRGVSSAGAEPYNRCSVSPQRTCPMPGAKIRRVR